MIIQLYIQYRICSSLFLFDTANMFGVIILSASILDESRAKCKYVEQTKGFGYIYFMSHLFDKQHYVSILSDFSQLS